MEDTTATCSPLIIPQPNACLNNQEQQTPFASELVIITKQQDIVKKGARLNLIFNLDFYTKL